MSAAEDLDDTRWSILHSRFRDPLDHVAAIAPEEPFVQQMLATREMVRRQYDEISAAVPAGLSPQQRGEWIAAQVLGSSSSV